MPEFTVAIVTRPEVKAAGLKIHTTMEKASVDCGKLWSETFMPHMESFPCDGSGASYGVCVMTSGTEFDYWATMPLGKDAKIPAGLSPITIPGGTYAECRVRSLQELNDAYTYLYMAWGATRADYAVNFQAPGVELYTPDFLKNGNLTVYAPLVKK